MKYGIWRHENALGNSAEHTFGLARHLKRTGDNDAHIFVEKPFQKAFAMCIPGIKESDISFFKDLKKMNYATPPWAGFDNPELSDIYMPDAYPFENTYPASWSSLSDGPDETLIFPEDAYNNKHNLPEQAIVISIRESGTYAKRVDGAKSEPERFVDPLKFIALTLDYAEQGHTVVRIGDRKQTPMPKANNILDFALVDDRNMLDDLFLISKSKVFLSCDAGIWPMAGGMKSNLILSNVMSAVEKPAIVDWLPPETSTVIYKRNEKLPPSDKNPKGGWRTWDNSFEQLRDAVDKYL